MALILEKNSDDPLNPLYPYRVSNCPSFPKYAGSWCVKPRLSEFEQSNIGNTELVVRRVEMGWGHALISLGFRV